MGGSTTRGGPSRIGTAVVLAVPVVVRAEELLGFERRPRYVEWLGCPGPGVGAGIVDRHFVPERVEVGAGDALDHVELIGMHHPERTARHPESFVETDRVDDQRVFLPPAHRMTEIGRIHILTGRM